MLVSVTPYRITGTGFHFTLFKFCFAIYLLQQVSEWLPLDEGRVNMNSTFEDARGGPLIEELDV